MILVASGYQWQEHTIAVAIAQLSIAASWLHAGLKEMLNKIVA